jgi:hypothetical protein
VRVTAEGRAKAGDCVRTRHGDIVEIVSITNAGDLIEAIGSQVVMAPNYTRDSIAGMCVLWGSTTGREKRNRERYLARLHKEKVPA